MMIENEDVYLLEDFAFPIFAFCPLCRAKEAEVATQIIAKQDDIQFFHFSCLKCSARLLVLAYQNEMGMSSLGILSDLESDEAMRMIEEPPMRFDDVLVVHHELEAGILY